MENHTEDCMICGKELTYFESAQDASCHICGDAHKTNVCCEDGHYVCDTCHAEKGLLFITRCINETLSRNPIEIATEIMRSPSINMHGPEHHYLVAASLLTAYKNMGGTVDLDAASRNILQRAKNVPGGICGMWGSCGAGISTGIFISVLTGASPLSEEEWSWSNRMTSRSLAIIAENGGPRCCKRNSYLSIQQAAAFTAELFGIDLELPKKITCEFSHRNNQCRKNNCPFYDFN